MNRVLGEDIEVELLAGDSGFESSRVYEALKARRIAPLIAWRRTTGMDNLADVISERDRIDEGTAHQRLFIKKAPGFIGGLHRSDEIHAEKWSVDVAELGEREHPSESGFERGLSCGDNCLSSGGTRPPAKCGISSGEGGRGIGRSVVVDLMRLFVFVGCYRDVFSLLPWLRGSG